jgi:hypothetical protein
MGLGPATTAASEDPGANGSCTWTTSGLSLRSAASVRVIAAGPGATGAFDPLAAILTLRPTPTKSYVQRSPAGAPESVPAADGAKTVTEVPARCSASARPIT